MTKDKFPRVLNGGEISDKPGRKFDYTEMDHLEAYFGKDSFRLSTLDDAKKDFNIFGFNDTLKNRFPVNKYLLMPEVEEARKKLKEKIGHDGFNGFNKSPEISNYLNTVNPMEEEYDRLEDILHPTDENRTLYQDLEARLDAHSSRKEKMGQDVIFGKEIDMIES